MAVQVWGTGTRGVNPHGTAGPCTKPDKSRLQPVLKAQEERGWHGLPSVAFHAVPAFSFKSQFFDTELALYRDQSQTRKYLERMITLCRKRTGFHC